MQVQEVSWFRRGDNNPVIIDPTVVIQGSTFSRSRTVLPSGSDHAATANKFVSATLGHPGTQSVMYSHIGAGTRLYSLAAEDVNMVKFGMTGADRVAGSPDDYNVHLVWEPDCASAEVEIAFVSSVPPPPAGTCKAVIIESFAQPGAVLHYTLVPDSPAPRLRIEIRADPTGTFYDRGAVLSWSSFETGDTLEWSSTEP